MQFYDAAYKIAGEKGISIENLSLSLGKTSRYVGSAKSRGSIPRIDNAAMILGAMDYVICAVPKDKVPEDAIVID